MTKKEKDAEKCANKILTLEKHLGRDLRLDELLLLALYESVNASYENNEKEKSSNHEFSDAIAEAALEICGIDLKEEIRTERICRRENEEIERQRALKNNLERLSMNANYGVVTKSCDDDEKLVVLCMINKTLKDMQGTLEGMQETLARVDDKI